MVVPTVMCRLPGCKEELRVGGDGLGLSLKGSLPDKTRFDRVDDTRRLVHSKAAWGGHLAGHRVLQKCA